MDQICRTIREEKGIEIHSDGARDVLHRKAVLERANGGRGVGNMLEREFLNPLACFLCTLPKLPSALQCRADAGDNLIFEVL